MTHAAGPQVLAEVEIPDSITPLRGVRAWAVSDDGKLEPVHQRITTGGKSDWAAARATASCDLEHGAPNDRCACGLYALELTDSRHIARELCRHSEAAFRSAGVVVGTVQASGKIIQHDHGFRAETMTIERLWLLRTPGKRGDRALAKKIEKRYRIPVALATVEEMLESLNLHLPASDQYRIERIERELDECCVRRRSLKALMVACPLLALLMGFACGWPTWATLTGMTTTGFIYGLALAMLATLLSGLLFNAADDAELTVAESLARIFLGSIVASLLALALCLYAHFQISTRNYHPPRLVEGATAVSFVDGRVNWQTRDTISHSASLRDPLWQRCTTSLPSSCRTIDKPLTVRKGQVIVITKSLRGSYLRAIGRADGFQRATAIIHLHS